MILVADESGLPAVEGILGSLDQNTRGTAIVEVPSHDDIRLLRAPDGVEVRWVVRTDGMPGVAALEALREIHRPDAAAHGFLVAESGHATGARRHLASAGLAKDRITFCGFWKH